MSVIRFPNYFENLPRLTASQNKKALDEQDATKKITLSSFYDFLEAQQAIWQADRLRLQRLENENLELIELLAKAYQERKELDKLVSEMKAISCSLYPKTR